MVIKKNILIGYRVKGIGTYKTKIKPLGYIVAGLGFALVGFGVLTLSLPTGSVFAISGGLSLLGLVGISTIKTEKKLRNKLRFVLWRLRR